MRRWFDARALPLALGAAAAAAFAILLTGLLGTANSVRDLNDELAATDAQIDALDAQAATAAEENRELLDLTARLQDQVNILSSDNSALAAANEELRAQNDVLAATSQTLEQQVAASVDARERLPMLLGAQQIVALNGTELAPEAGGAFYLHDTAGLLVVNGLQTLSEEETYQLWLVLDDGEALSVGLLRPEDDEPTTIAFELPPREQAIANVSISLEPAGGSNTMDGPPILLGDEGESPA